jgi:Dihaem cytochrome c
MKLAALLIIMLASGMNPAFAAGKLSAPNNEKWKQECGACHDAYPPQFLTAKDWRLLMEGLDKHFGANASLDPAVNKQILRFLQANAGSGDRYSSASLRITETPWFKHEHHVISPKEWVNPQVKSRSNCSACHGRVILGS